MIKNIKMQWSILNKVNIVLGELLLKGNGFRRCSLREIAAKYFVLIYQLGILLAYDKFKVICWSYFNYCLNRPYLQWSDWKKRYSNVQWARFRQPKSTFSFCRFLVLCMARWRSNQPSICNSNCRSTCGDNCLAVSPFMACNIVGFGLLRPNKCNYLNACVCYI